MTLAMLLFVVLTGLAVGGFAYALLQPRIAMERNARGRLEQFKGAETDATSRRQARERVAEVAKRRRNLQASLKAVEEKQKQHDRIVARIPLARRLQQAGLSMSPRGFVLASIGAGVGAFLLALLLGASPFLALGVAVAGGLGLPRWMLSHLRKRRMQRFVDEFANAIDVIVRGVKSGLPLNDTLRIVAAEAREPVGSEFRKVVEAQQLGISTADAVDRLYQNVPLAETNFFSIVIAIQAQAGGNLSEALGNLSRVLRERKKMKAKIQAMSMEAKASGWIIGCLPVVVAFMIFLTTPAYLDSLFNTQTGHLILIASAVWMATGVVVMKKMISFDF
ncbi:type II secretion system F family protein [Aureimonas populi]|uniref:Type II secretion system F family protein n=1 Tax=Aureimonas populi TaxID=1701758 RepID=A0ABW5CNQ0_9HYPH|nr:type II secretion system F family protein [Aureimonas populi]